MGVLGAIAKAVRRATEHGVVKTNFIVDLAESGLDDQLREALANYNLERSRYKIARLWVMTGGQLIEIQLKRE